MKSKRLLNLAMTLFCGLTVSAQTVVFQESFDAEQTKQPTDVGYYEFINTDPGDTRTIEAEGAFSGTGCLHFYNIDSVAGQAWQRAVKFRNLPLQEGKSYRITYRIKGANVWSDGTTETKSKANVALMQGGENADIAILNPDGGEQTYSVQDFNESEYLTYSHMFYFASAQAQKDKYAENNPDKDPLADTFFATFNIYNPGDYFLDEVVLYESPIRGIGFYTYCIRVDLGYSNNIAALANASLGKIMVMPEGCATVKVNDAEKTILSTELRSDGFLYIFLEDELAETDKVEVAFTNPEGEKQIQYTGSLKSLGAAFNFTGEVASYDPSLEGLDSYIYAEPFVVSTTPADGSFNLEETINSVTFMFDKALDLSDSYPVTALVNGKADLVNLEGVTVGEDVMGVKVTLKEGTFTMGSYTISLEGITSSMGTTSMDKFILTFETGKVKLAETTYELVLDNKTVTDAEAGIPNGWTLMVGENVHAGGTGARGFLYTNSNVQSAVYMRDWEGKAVLIDTVAVPAGDMELRAYSAGWGTTGLFLITLKKADGTVVFSENIAVSTSLAKDRTGNFQVDPIRFKSEGGDYIYSVELASGSNELLHAGFEVYSYTVSGGAVSETEVIAEGSFAQYGNDYMPAHGSGWKIYRNDGRMRDPGAIGAWVDDADWTGGGGPRVRTLGNKNLNGGGIYLNGGAWATYGEFAVQTDHGGPVLDESGAEVPEKTLDVKAGRYQISYGVIGWKLSGDGPWNITLDIFKFEDGTAGTPVYTRIDGSTNHTNGGSDGGPEATLVRFFWNAPADGRYILKFTASGTGEGEAVVGNVLVETTSSLAVQYAEMLNKALEPAIEELALAQEKDEYRGTTRDALEAAIAKYTNPDYHTVAEYEAAFADIDALVKASAARRANIDAYPTNLQALVDGLAAAEGTKYVNIEQYAVVQAAYAQYKDVDYIALSDEELAAAVAAMGDNGTLLSNMVNTCIPLITQQITDLASAIVALDNTMTEDATVIAAGNAFTDDQNLVSLLKKIYAAKLYQKVANGDDIFSVIDTVSFEPYPTTVEASFLIQNSQFYCTTPVVKSNTAVDVTAFPGWTIEQLQGQITSVFSLTWGEKYPTPVKPIENCAVKTGWGTQEYTVEQIIADLPVFKYEVSIKIGEDGAAPHTSYAYCGEDSLVYEGTVAEDGSVSATRDNNTEANLKLFTDVVPVVGEGAVLGSVTLGAHMMVNGGFGNVDDATLTMVAKDKDFDYAAAAKKLADDIADGIESAVQPEGEPMSVRFYDLNGRQVSTPNGVTIKVEAYKNGFMKVSKVVIK